MNQLFIVSFFFSFFLVLFLFQNSPKDQDPSYMMDLDLKNCYGMENMSYYRKNEVLSFISIFTTSQLLSLTLCFRAFKDRSQCVNDTFNGQ